MRTILISEADYYDFDTGNCITYDQPLYNKLHDANIKVGERIFKIVDATIIDGILDKEKSNIKYFKDGRIMNIKNYVFKLIPNIPSIFKIPELKTFTFVTEDVIKALIEAKKTEGLDYLECEVS